MVLGALPVHAYALLRVVGADWIVWSDGVRMDALFSTVGGPNEFAAYLLVVVPCAVQMTPRSGHGALRVARGTVAAAAVAALILTGSRAGLVGIVIMGAVTATTARLPHARLR